MISSITIKVYPLFGCWRAECTTCGNYTNSGGDHYSHLSEIGQALEKLSYNLNECKHFYGNYKPRVNVVMEFSDLVKVKEPYFTRGSETIPSILLDNEYVIELKNPFGINFKWNSYSFIRNMPPKKEKIKFETTKHPIVAKTEKEEKPIPPQLIELRKEIDKRLKINSYPAIVNSNSLILKPEEKDDADEFEYWGLFGSIF